MTAETVIELAYCVHGERRGLFPVKRTNADVVLASRFFQREVFANDPDDVCLLLYELGEV